MIPKVGVCTRPDDSCALNLVVSARVAFNPTYQSASERATAEAYKFSYFLPGCNFLKPSRIALSVTDEIHNRLIGFFTRALSIIQRATSSPSLPASVAIMMSFTSFRFNWLFTILYCFPVLGITTVLRWFGTIGKSSIRHVLYLSSYISGVANVTKCPNAHVTIYFWPSKKPFPFFEHPNT